MLHVQFLDESLGPLALLYNQIIKFVERDLKKLAESVEVICVKSGSKKPRIPPPPAAPNAQGLQPRKWFDIMANVVWAEIGQAIMEELGPVVFAAGKTDEFRKVSRLRANYPIHSHRTLRRITKQQKRLSGHWNV
jgi:hypothetical protein